LKREKALYLKKVHIFFRLGKKGNRLQRQTVLMGGILESFRIHHSPASKEKQWELLSFRHHFWGILSFSLYLRLRPLQIQFLRPLLRFHQGGTQLSQRFLRRRQSIEKQKIFLG
jgi:hypothetical protein